MAFADLRALLRERVRAGVLIGCARKSTTMVFARTHACEPTVELADRARARNDDRRGLAPEIRRRSKASVLRVRISTRAYRRQARVFAHDGRQRGPVPGLAAARERAH